MLESLMRLAVLMPIPILAVALIVRYKRLNEEAPKRSEMTELREELAALRRAVEDQYAELTLMMNEQTERKRFEPQREPNDE